jgi:hypothetical protein
MILKLANTSILIVAMCAPTAAAPQSELPQTYINGLSTAPSYFPIGVWLQSPSLALEYKAIGVNLFVGLNQGPTEQQLAELAKLKMSAIAEQNDVGLTSRNAGMIVGWLEGDEPDNAQPAAGGSWGPCIPAKDVARRSAEIKTRDPTRPVLINFGRGVAEPNWIGRGPCTGDTAYYDLAASEADIISLDIYPVAFGLAKLDYPARGVAHLRAISRDRQRVWVAIETTHIDSKVGRVTPEQLRSEVWLALIRGADGLVYFAHEWAGGFREDGLFRYPEIVQAIKDINATVTQLAPILNNPTIEGRVAVAAPISTASMLKERDGILYLFAGSTDVEAGRATFSLRDFANGRAEVVGENRSLPIVNGRFEDTFDSSYQIHIYRISGDD